MQPLAEQIKTEAARLGFALCGITSALPPPHHRQYAQWLAEGKAGEMLYLHRQEPKRGDLTQVLPSAKSVVCVALNYSPEDGPPAPNYGGAGQGPGSTSEPGTAESSVAERLSFNSSPALPVPGPSPVPGTSAWPGSDAAPTLTGTVARYARFDDYHDTLWQRPRSLARVYPSPSPRRKRQSLLRYRADHRAGPCHAGRARLDRQAHQSHLAAARQLVLSRRNHLRHRPARRRAGNDALRDVYALPAGLPDRGHHRALQTGRPPVHFLPHD